MSKTPHINAQNGDFAKTVLMPGDPLRAKFIAENFLENARLVNNVRGVQGYTGTYKGVPVSVMASGMGMPSIAIYSYELFTQFSVENIIRVGSAGAMQENVNVRDIVIAAGASTNSAFAHKYDLPGTFSAIADFSLLKLADETAKEQNLNYHVGNILSSDTFYSSDARADNFRKLGVLAVEMEAAALYMTAAETGKHALCICTVSDHLLRAEATTAQERETSFTDMMKLALEIAVKAELK
jgi:purine-nucleoside phosphorylase